MSKYLWKSLLLSPAALAATLVVSSSASATPTAITATVPQPQAVDTKAPEGNVVVAVTYGTAKPNAAAPGVLNADAGQVFPTVDTKSEQPIAVNVDTPTQVAVMPAAKSEQATFASKETPDQVVVTPSSQIVADNPEAAVAQVTVTPTQTPVATGATPAESSASPTYTNSLDQFNRYSNEGTANNSIAQVTSVSQLSDVQPTDWAFQALQSLVERYGCIAGYPDGTYRGNRALTRYEFAAGLNACLDRVNELIAAATADLVRREDLATLQRLQEEFAAELATLRGRVDTLEAATAELEANQFSTTTKLVGEAIAAVTDTFGDDVEDNTVFQNRIRLDFQTSFFGEDILHTRLATGNARPFSFSALNPEATAFKTFEGTQTFNVQPDSEYSNNVFLDWLAYDFPLFGNSRAYVAAVGGIHSDYAATVNPYFEDYDGGNGALSTFAQENPIYRIGGGAGGGVTLAFGGGGILRPSSLTFGYLADNPNDPGLDFGIGNGDYAALGQVNFNLGDRIGLAATYVHGYHNAGNGIFDLGGSFGTSNQSTGPIVGTLFANNPGLVAGLDTPLVTNSYGLSAALRLSDKISLSAFGTYTDVTLLGLGDGEIWTYGAGVAFPDLGKEGNLLGLFAGVEPTLRNLDVPGDPGFSNDYGYHIEGFYKYRLTDNISITPGVIWLTAPGQDDDNEDVIIGTLRTTFNF
jgi:hypothetical protein